MKKKNKLKKKEKFILRKKKNIKKLLKIKEIQLEEEMECFWIRNKSKNMLKD